MKEINKPYVILSAAMTIDGKIATRKGDSELSDKVDWKEVHKLRASVDAIMVGKGTILKDNPKLHIKYHKHRGYYRIVLDSNLTIPLESNVITFQQELYPTIICTVENVPSNKVKTYEDKGIRIIQIGDGNRVNISKLLSILKEFGINSMLLEGGGTLNWSFVEKNLIDEIRLTISPWIVGGKEATSLVDGIGFEKISSAPRFDLFDVKIRTYYITLSYKRNK
ncbi:MAG: 2,5-diamino-6-(ribosylamino)-4(3H)-pyrimidinone 5'-phosphate reductase [Promethearchaeota archaeon]